METVTDSSRIPKELKRRMDELRNYVNWSEEVRRFLEKRVMELEQMKAIQDLEKIISFLLPAPRGTAVRYVGEDRDSG